MKYFQHIEIMKKLNAKKLKQKTIAIGKLEFLSVSPSLSILPSLPHTK